MNNCRFDYKTQIEKEDVELFCLFSVTWSTQFQFVNCDFRIYIKYYKIQNSNYLFKPMNSESHGVFCYLFGSGYFLSYIGITGKQDEFRITWFFFDISHLTLCHRLVCFSHMEQTVKAKLVNTHVQKTGFFSCIFFVKLVFIS